MMHMMQGMSKPLMGSLKISFEHTNAKVSSPSFNPAKTSYDHFKIRGINLLQPLIDQKVISAGIGRQIAGSRQNYDQPHLGFKINPRDSQIV